MSQHLGPRLLALHLLLAAVAVLGAAPAHAERDVTRDAAGDVSRVTYAAGTGDPVLSPAPDETAVDVIRTVVDHRTARLSVTIGFRDLARLPSFTTEIRVRTPRGTFSVMVDRQPAQGTETTLSRGSRTVGCRGLRSAIDPGADRVSVVVPSSCLSAPRWVQVGAGVVSFFPDESTTDPTDVAAVADDGHRSGEVAEEIALGPRVRRG